MVTFKVAAEIDGSAATNFRPSNNIHLQLVSFQQGENLKICHERFTLHNTLQKCKQLKKQYIFKTSNLHQHVLQVILHP